MKKIIKLKLLTLSICLAHQAYALEQIEERDLSGVTGQDGIIITHEISHATINQLNWYDPNPAANQKMGLGLHNVKINGVDDKPIISQLAIDLGGTDRGTGLHIDASLAPFNIIADLNLVKKQCVGSTCSTALTQSLGQLGISTKTPIGLVLKTSAGLFNINDTAYMDFQLQNANISHKLGNNSLILNDLNFNFAGSGYMYLSEHDGIVLATNNGLQDHYIDLGRVADTTDVSLERNKATNPGLNLDLRYQANGQTKNIMRMGASGALTNARLSVGANQEGITDFGTAGRLNGGNTTANNSYDAIGTGGLRLGMSAEFSSESDTNRSDQLKPTTLEIGHTGKDSYAVEFSNLRPLTTHDANGSAHKKNAYIDFGNIYINTIQANNLDFQINNKIKQTLGKDNNIVQQILSDGQNNSNFALIAIRDMDFQSIAAKARFISDNSLAELGGSGGTWGIGIPIYNLNANVALSGTQYGPEDKYGIAYNITASTEGYGIDTKTKLPSTTSMILIDGQDGVHGEAVNYYAGFRNIDALIQSEGVIGYEDEGIYIRADKLLIAANAELAIGQLPGSKYNCQVGTGNNCGQLVPFDNFSKRDDVLTNIAFKLDGKGELMIIPGVDPTPSSPNSNFLSFDANFKFRPLSVEEKADSNNLGSYFSLSNIDGPEDNLKTSAINFNRMEGHLALKAKVKLSADTVTLDNQVHLNKSNDINQPFRTNFAMLTNNKMQNMANIAITGGTLRSTMGITPR
ncbi:DUF6160 family protein [Acinetobacter schindleri]|uniref:DUF6160 family protein n=1 Tax=Acinetobacter schindleri TaxID=108981 RepID=UPI00209AC61A|nr:DUF6160 family protein [Acinetobacter schindleri]MCO8067081.1 hypothetical protein [Acinetobacter schindleri]